MARRRVSMLIHRRFLARLGGFLRSRRNFWKADDKLGCILHITEFLLHRQLSPNNPGHSVRVISPSPHSLDSFGDNTTNVSPHWVILFCTHCQYVSSSLLTTLHNILTHVFNFLSRLGKWNNDQCRYLQLILCNSIPDSERVDLFASYAFGQPWLLGWHFETNCFYRGLCHVPTCVPCPLEVPRHQQPPLGQCIKLDGWWNQSCNRPAG